MASLRFPEFSVKVVRHKNWEYFCGRLWKSLGALPGTFTGFSGQAMVPEKLGYVPSGSCEEIVSRANNVIAKLAGVGRLRM
jgi:hypothetical protein